MTKDEKPSMESIPKEYLDAMPHKQAALYYALFNSTCSLRQKWEHFNQLYGTSPEIVLLLNETAPAFFSLVQRTLHNEILLHICRLTDPKETRSKGKKPFKNITIRRLPDFVSESDIGESLNEEIKLCISKSEYARQLRDKKIGHHDLDHAIYPLTYPMESHSRSCIQYSVDSITTIFNLVNSKLFNKNVEFDYLVTRGSKQSILYALYDSKELQKQKLNWTKDSNQIAKLFPDPEFSEN